MFPEEHSHCVTFQLGPSVWGQRLERLCVSCLAQLMVGPLNPEAPKLWQEDKRKGAFSPQNLFQNEKKAGKIRVTENNFSKIDKLA